MPIKPILPGQVFQYLHQQKVGAHTALFWLAWAFVAEKDTDFPFAHRIFKKGINNNTAPLQMLELYHKQFQRRMSRHWLNSCKTNDQLNDEYESGEQNKSSRSSLGINIKSSKSQSQQLCRVPLGMPQLRAGIQPRLTP